MDALDTQCYEEYYIACNPPLTLFGVDEVISKSGVYLQDELVEILYEPEAGWFKLISDNASRDDVTQFVEDVIYSIGEEEATIAKGNTPVNAEQRRQLPDVDISGDKPRILRWAKHEACPTNPEAFEPYAFPEGITTAPYRHIWRGVEECPDLDDINQLLLKASHTWMASELPKTMDDAERVLGCQVVWNLRGTVLYMSSFDSAETVLNAAKKLDLAISILSSERAPFVLHTIAAPGDPKVGFQWISHLGLDSRLNHSFASEMPSGTAKPAVLRTAQLVKPDYWVVDKTSYPHRSVADGEQPAQFSAFAGFAYRAKECVQPRINENFIKASSGPREQRPQRQPRPRPLKKSPGKFDRTHAPSGQVVVAPVRQGGHNDLKVKRWAADVHEATERHNLRVPAGHVTPHKTDISSIGHGPCALIDTGASDDMPPAFPKDTSTSADLLGSVLDKDDGALSRYEAMAPHLDYSSGVTPAGPRSEVSSDLIDFSQDEDQDRHIVQIVEPSTTSLGAQQSHDEVACSDNGNDASAIDLAECLVKFGIEEDRPKDIRQTMNQQAGVRRRSTKKFVPLDTTRSTTPAQRRSTWSGLFKQQATVGPAPSPPASPVAADFLPGSMREELAGQVSSIMETLRVVPGNVTLELKFGLVWFRNLSEADVAINGTNPLWGLSTFQGDLNKEPHKADVGFEGVLSLRGDDADTLTKLHPAIDGQEAGWEEPDLAAQYEFVFSRPAQFRVIVDASTFKHQCLGPQEDVSSTYIHCPRNVWDLKIAACRAGGGTLPVECSKIAESLVASLAISTNDAGDVTLDGCIPRALATAIESARIIHLAQYKSNPAKDCLLTVKMTRPLAQDFKIKGANATFVWKPMPTTAHGRPQEFFEASLSSVRMEQALQENASLHFGNEVAWQTTDVQHESSIEEIFQIGFGMVALMDKIGSVGSEEARGPRFSRTGPAPKTEQQQGGGYW